MQMTHQIKGSSPIQLIRVIRRRHNKFDILGILLFIDRLRRQLCVKVVYGFVRSTLQTSMTCLVFW